MASRSFIDLPIRIATTTDTAIQAAMARVVSRANMFAMVPNRRREITHRVHILSRNFGSPQSCQDFERFNFALASGIDTKEYDEARGQ
ncbi:UNVERIFIED_CONTAM: hypothetical protein DES50_101239 [Williamsia faeni]